jgi:hypothetical protein
MTALKAIDAVNTELRQRNDVRLAEAKLALGKKYLLHPENAMSREKFRKISKVTS